MFIYMYSNYFFSKFWIKAANDRYCRSVIVENINIKIKTSIEEKQWLVLVLENLVQKTMIIPLVIAEITNKEYVFKIVVGSGSSLQYVEFKKCEML